MILLTMLLIPILVALGFFMFSGKNITIGEFLGQNALQLLIMLPFAFGGGCMSTHDIEIWNGRVIEKSRVKVSCSHSYPCRCRSVSCGKGCTTMHCDTCYSHSYDVDWRVKTNNDERFEIDRVNSQGTIEPPRWTQVKIGEPTSLPHSYTNYVKASPDSLFRRQGLLDKYANNIPSYPKVYDYHRFNPLVLANGAILYNGEDLKKKLTELNADLGQKKQVNIMVLLVKDLPQEYFYAVEQAWIGSKKNDFVVVAGIDISGKIQWTNVMAWTENKMAEVVVRDAVLKIGDANKVDEIVQAIGAGVSNHYIRKSMEDFAYLKNAMTPTFGTWIAAMIIGLISSIGLGIFFFKNGYDHDDEMETVFKTNKRRYY